MQQAPTRERALQKPGELGVAEGDVRGLAFAAEQGGPQRQTDAVITGGGAGLNDAILLVGFARRTAYTPPHPPT